MEGIRGLNDNKKYNKIIKIKKELVFQQISNTLNKYHKEKNNTFQIDKQNNNNKMIAVFVLMLLHMKAHDE